MYMPELVGEGGSKLVLRKNQLSKNMKCD